MSLKRIGILTFRADPLNSIVPSRLRALQAEALLNNSLLVILDWRDFGDSNDEVLCWWWTTGGWRSEISPVPDVVIVVGAPVMDEQQRLKELVCATRPYINDVGMNKLELRDLLKDSQYDEYFIPDAQIPKTDGDKVIADFLAENGSAVIKRSNGNQGKGIFFLLQEGDSWRLHGQESDTFTLPYMANAIMNKIQGRLAYRDFVIQKYIRSVAADGRAADIRVHVQRDQDHNWVITRAYVRLAEVGSMATNVSLGGYQGPLKRFLELRKNRPAAAILDEMKKAAIDIAEIQSSAAPQQLSELGIDFLLDEEDKLWLIETNALPQSSLHEHERAIHTISYALSLI